MRLKSSFNSNFTKLIIKLLIIKSAALVSNSTKLLIFSNLVNIVAALYFNWSVFSLMIIFWCQSLIIGFFTILKMLFLKHVHWTARVSGILNFAALYGIFHIIFLVLIIIFFSSSELISYLIGSAVTITNPLDFVFILFGPILFFINHLYSFLVHRQAFAKTKPSVETVMTAAWIRVVPMYTFFTFVFPFAFIFLIISFFSGFNIFSNWIFSFFALLGFSFFKLVVDVLAHVN